jgi:hypothetical protein
VDHPRSREQKRDSGEFERIPASVVLAQLEIQLGSSLFLFDSDYDLQNAQFSDKSVYLSAPHAETVEAPVVATLDQAADRPITQIADAESLSLLQQVGEMLAPGIGPMSEALPRIVERLAAFWTADAGASALGPRDGACARRWPGRESRSPSTREPCGGVCTQKPSSPMTRR